MQHFHFANIFSNKRKELGVTQQQIAEYIGVSKAAVSKWEQGVSYPDITLLPKLATYFNVSIDELLGYEPQLTKERIIEYYQMFAHKLGQEPFEQVELEIEALLKEYYTCFPLVVNMAQLYLNYLPKSANYEATLERIVTLCQHVISRADKYKIVREAEMMLSYVMLLMGKPEQVIEQLGEEVTIHYGAEQLIAKAYMMLGQVEKTNEILQVSMYQSVLGTIMNGTERLMLETANPEQFDETVNRIEAMLKLFHMENMNINLPLVFYMQAATGYMVQHKKDRALEMLHRYYQTCCKMQFPLQLKGDDYFYLVSNWISQHIDLGSLAPRDDFSIKKDIVGLLKSAAFDDLQTDPQFISLLNNLKHLLNIEEEKI